MVFYWTHVCLTNDKTPGAITKGGKLKTNEDWNSDNDGDGLFNCMDADCKGKTKFFLMRLVVINNTDCPTGYTCAMGIGEDNLHVCLSTTNFSRLPGLLCY